MNIVSILLYKNVIDKGYAEFKSLTKEKCFKKEIASKVFETQFI